MSRTVCYVEKETGMSGTCSQESKGLSGIDCDKCPFRKQYQGREQDHFSYCNWLGDVQEADEFGKDIVGVKCHACGFVYETSTHVRGCFICPKCFGKSCSND